MNDETPASIGQRIVSGGVELLRSRLLSEPPALPLVPKHEGDAACGGFTEPAVRAAGPGEARKNPFAELAKLKRGK